jgi:hypothetical protein
MLVTMMTDPLAEKPAMEYNTPGMYYFDYNILKEYSLKAALLPSEAKVINQPESFWRTYSNQIMKDSTGRIVGIVENDQFHFAGKDSFQFFFPWLPSIFFIQLQGGYMLNTDAAAIAVLKILLNVFIVFSPFSMCCVLFVLRLFIRRSSIGSPPVINKKAVFWISPETTLIAVPL